MRLFDYRCKIVNHTVNEFNNFKTVILNWENGITTTYKTLYDLPCGFKINVFGTKGNQEIIFKDTFNAFKNALSEFISIIRKEKENNSKIITQKAIEIIEKGNND